MHIDLKYQASGLDRAYQDVIRLWMLRALVHRNGAAEFVTVHGFSEAPVARHLGFTDFERKDGYTMACAIAGLEAKLAELEEQAPGLPEDSVLSQNIARLSTRLGLSDVDRCVLHYTTLIRLDLEFARCIKMVGDLTHAALCQLLAVCLDFPPGAIRTALEPKGKLCRSGLIEVNRRRSFRSDLKLEMPEGLAEELMMSQDNLLDLFASSVAPVKPSTLTLDAFSHLYDDIQILRGYLEAATHLQQSGVNILIYGPPGTGKTQFSRVLGQSIGASLFEVPVDEADGEPRQGKKRFSSFQLAQSLLAGSETRHLLLFEEVEDVFCEQHSHNALREGNASGIKGWVNQLLENNPVSTIWITNHLDAIDPAYLRRFDYILHMDVPPKAVRRRLIDLHTQNLDLAVGWREKAAEHPSLVPAIVQRAAKVSEQVCDVNLAVSAEHVLSRVMNNTFEALGVQRLSDGSAASWTDYRLDLLNADCDLGALLEGLRRVGAGRICLYGPPGTGKSAYGRYIAEQLDRPLMVKRASDLLSPYLGKTEQLMARMFREARRDGALLLLDEADSFLQDRQGAQRSWEVTQVNEMLTQMESYQGIFIASTNMMDSIDAAALRRFDASVRFGYLGPAQVEVLFEELLKQLQLPLPANGIKGWQGLRTLTPGDFAAVRRGCGLNCPADAETVIERLVGLAQLKSGAVKAQIGFHVSTANK